MKLNFLKLVLMMDEELMVKRTLLYRELEKKYNDLKKIYEGGFRKRKSFFEISDVQKKRAKKQFLQSNGMGQMIKLADSHGLKISEIILISKETITDSKINLKIEKVNLEREEKLLKSVFIKDKFNISNECYNSLNTICQAKLPSLYQIIAKKKDLNNKFNNAHNEKGTYTSVKEKLRVILLNLFEHNNFCESIINNTIWIIISIDATKIYLGNKTLNVSFSILNDIKRSSTASGTYLLGIFEVENDDYNEIKAAIEPISRELQEIKSIQIHDDEYLIEQVLVNDMKAQNDILGLKCANSNHPCPNCIYKKNSTNKENYMTETWSIRGETSRMSTFYKSIIQDIQIKGKCSKFDGTYCQVNPPLFPHITSDRNIVDMLHLFLRITDKLTQLLFKQIDSFETSFSSNENKEKYISFLKDICQIRKPAYKDANTNSLNLRDLRGNEMRKVYSNMEKLKTLFPKLPNVEKIVSIWESFYNIITDIQNRRIGHKEIKNQTMDWLKLFLEVYNSTNITPYIHQFVYHLHEFDQIYGHDLVNINSFSLQGMEKKNDLVTSQFYQGSNRHQKNNRKKTEDFLSQLLKKNNRLDYLSTKIQKTT